MRLNQKGIDLMHEFEGLRLQAYLCPANIPTIGWGNTFYESGRKVQMGETITKERADALFLWVANSFATQVRSLLRVQLNENQFSALVSFAYNVGVGNLRSSTLLMLVNANPNDPNIRAQFLRWNKAGGREMSGLTRRRQSESNLYFDKL